MACRDEYSKRKCDRRCVVCNEESIRGHSCGGDDGLPGLVILEEIETGLLYNIQPHFLFLQ